MPDITVTFTPPNTSSGVPAQFSFSGSPLNVTTTSSSLTISLSPNTVTWADPPISWVDPNGSLAPAPECMSYSVSNGVLTIQDINTLNSTSKLDQISYYFVVNVVYSGNTYTSPDPTIVNKEVTSGGGSQDDPKPAAGQA